MNAKTITLEEICLDHFGLPGVMVMTCELNIEIDSTGDWFIDKAFLGDMRAPANIEASIKSAVYENEKTCDYIRDELND
jgi:hypothetical protein